MQSSTAFRFDRSRAYIFLTVRLFPVFLFIQIHVHCPPKVWKHFYIALMLKMFQTFGGQCKYSLIPGELFWYSTTKSGLSIEINSQPSAESYSKIYLSHPKPRLSTIAVVNQGVKRQGNRCGQTLVARTSGIK